MMERGLAVIEVESENGCMSESYVQGINEKAPQFLEDIEWYSIEHWQGSVMKQLLVTILNLAMVEGVNDEKEKECLPRKHSVSLCAWSAFTPISLNLVHYHTHFTHFMLTVPSLLPLTIHPCIPPLLQYPSRTAYIHHVPIFVYYFIIFLQCSVIPSSHPPCY